MDFIKGMLTSAMRLNKLKSFRKQHAISVLEISAG